MTAITSHRRHWPEPAAKHQVLAIATMLLVLAFLALLSG